MTPAVADIGAWWANRGRDSITSEVMARRALLPILPRMPSPIGSLVRKWRERRAMSQEGLAALAGVSPRHLSFVETGRAQASRELVLALCKGLEVPLRSRNELLLAAGFAPRYRETALAAPEMAEVRRALHFMLRQQEPYPAIVLDRPVPGDGVPQGRRAPGLLHHHRQPRHALRHHAARAAHRVLLPRGRSNRRGTAPARLGGARRPAFHEAGRGVEPLLRAYDALDELEQARAEERLDEARRAERLGVVAQLRTPGDENHRHPGHRRVGDHRGDEVEAAD